MANSQIALDAPEYTDAELRAARAYINAQRKQFNLHLEYATELTYTTTATMRADGPVEVPTDA